jgi:hypothetical protein
MPGELADAGSSRESRGCADATARFRAAHDALIRSFEPGENWGWCYVDELFLEPASVENAELTHSRQRDPHDPHRPLRE